MGKAKALTGAAGEHYIAFQLSARGYTVGFTSRGTAGVDLLVTNLETGKSITAQVKTMSNAFVRSRKWGSYWKWRVGVSRPSPRETLYYLFVNLGDDLSVSPDVFVVPSGDLRLPLLEEYPEKSPKPTDAWAVIYDKDKDTYLNCWSVLDKALG